MATIPEDIVESTWREMAAMEPPGLERLMEGVTRRQPALLAYVMAELGHCGRYAQELTVYLFLVVLQMFERLPGHRLGRVSIRQVERRAAKNETMLERLASAHERFLELAARAQADSQPHVFRYLIEAILEGDDSDVELTEEESGLVFLVLKTVVDLLERACKKRRR